MKLLNTNSRQLQFSRAFDRISQTQSRLWLVICAIIVVNVATALAYRYWPAARDAAGIEFIEMADETAPNAPAALTIPANDSEITEEEAVKIAQVEAEAATSTVKITENKVQTTVETKAAKESKEPEKAAGAVEAENKKLPTEPASENIPAQAETIKTPEAEAETEAEIVSENENTPDFAAAFIEISRVGLPVMRVAALLCAVMVAAAISLALKLSLLGRLGAADKLTSAFIWSVMLIFVLVPWSAAFDGFPLPAATMLQGEIITATTAALAEGADWTDSVLYFSRVAAYPALALILAFAVQLQFFRARGPIDDTINKHIRDDDDDLEEMSAAAENTPRQ